MTNLTSGYTDYVTHGAGPAPRSERPARGPVEGNFQMLTGGVLRYSMATEDPGIATPVSPQPAVRANVGAVYRSDANGSTVALTNSSYTVGQDTVGGATGVLAGARNRFGNPIAPHDIEATTLIRYGQSETQAQVLEKMGVLARDHNGRYYEVGTTPGVQSPQQQPQQSRQAATVDDSHTVEYFPDHIEAQLTRAIDPIPQAMYQSALAKMLDGGLKERDYHEMARLSNLSVEDFRERADFVDRAFAAQALSAHQN
jgi:hypothetical protein